jgi:hypothetical protein
MGRHINFETGNYYEQAAPKRKKGKDKKETVRAPIWYVGNGYPDAVPQSEWLPNAETYPPRLGDIYVNSRTAEYLELTRPEHDMTVEGKFASAQ